MLSACAQPQLRATGDLGLVVERADGALQLDLRCLDDADEAMFAATLAQLP